jgi:hypothetical protein
MPTDAAPRDKRTRLWQSHPIAIALTVAVIFFLIGGLVVFRRSGSAPIDDVGSWGPSSITLQDPQTAPRGNESNATSYPIPLATAENTDTTLRFRPAGASTSPKSTTSGADAGFANFLAGIFTSSAPASSETALDTGISAYFYLPQGLAQLRQEQPKTPEQAALHAYGNAAGSLALGFEASYPAMLESFSAFIDDHESEAQRAALRSIAKRFTDFSAVLQAVDAPTAAQSAHSAFAQSYATLGESLAAIADAEGDEAFIDAINAYNAAAELSTARFLDISTLFSVAGVTFQNYEGGSAFVFVSGF